MTLNFNHILTYLVRKFHTMKNWLKCVNFILTVSVFFFFAINCNICHT
jgi:hypothetical protein